MRSEHLLALSFAGLIALGTVGFRTLPGLYQGEPLSWLDALFTATSAVCVTGLIVVDTATYFTPLGQAYVLLLVQLGGLGILTLTTAIILALGGRPSLRHEAVSALPSRVAREVDFRRLTLSIIGFTLVLEALGAALLFVAWRPWFDAPSALWHAVFHSISAFCNAGFSTFSDSLVQVRESALGMGTVSLLIVVGGIGFVTLEEVSLWLRRRREGRRVRLSLHSRLALTVTAVLLSAGALVLGALEWGNTLAGMSLPVRLQNAFFMSVTARTAGFNTIDYAAAADSTNFVTILLMSIGGSPGSTAGGLKTTAVAAIGLLAISRVRGHANTSAWGRTLPDETLQRAVGLFVVAFTTVTGAILLFSVLYLTPHQADRTPGFLHYMFEAVSAFNTVGLSMGATSALDSTGKAVTIALMYTGRVGMLTIATAISLRRRGTDGFRYGYEDVIVG